LGLSGSFSQPSGSFSWSGEGDFCIFLIPAKPSVEQLLSEARKNKKIYSQTSRGTLANKPMGVWHRCERNWLQIKQALRATCEHFMELPVAVLPIDYRCNNRLFWLSAHNCQVPTPTSQNLELEQ
jgi:hypothetical protein